MTPEQHARKSLGYQRAYIRLAQQAERAGAEQLDRILDREERTARAMERIADAMETLVGCGPKDGIIVDVRSGP